MKITLFLIFFFITSLLSAEFDYNAIIKINVASQQKNYAIPWLNKDISNSSGTGFVIENNIIITNAHVVANAKYIELQKYNDSRNFNASVSFISHSLDLALLKVTDQDFFDNITPLQLSNLPELNSTVHTVGYPIGGDTISFTTGIVSRIDHIEYAHPQNEYHLAVQTDAAINPGNSGGPVIQDNKVVGVAFQGISSGDNIGYMIPTTLISHFLKDSADGKIDGIPELGIYYSDLTPYIKEYLKLDTQYSGIIINDTLKEKTVHKLLKKNDLITHIDGYQIDNKGNILIDSHKLKFYEILERKQVNESVELKIVRENKPIIFNVSLESYKPPFLHANNYPDNPVFRNINGLVFTKLTMDYLTLIPLKWWSDSEKYIYYYEDLLNPDRKIKEYFVLSEVIKNDENYHAYSFKNLVVKKINDIEIHTIEDLDSGFNNNKSEYHVISFRDRKSPLILRNFNFEN